MSKNINLKYKKLGLMCLALVSFTSQTACVPLAILGGAGAVGYTVSQERTIGSTLDDASIEAQINAKYLSQKDKEILLDVDPDSVDGRVLLTGTVPTREARIQAYKMALQAKGVKEVINEIKVDPNTKFSATEIASDAWISTQIESRLLFDKNISTVNYSIETIQGDVFLMGTAQSRDELERVTKIASETSGVKRVVSYVRIKGVEYKDYKSPENETFINQEVDNGYTDSTSVEVQSRESISSESRALVIEESPNAE